jgi:hypothetical protein
MGSIDLRAAAQQALEAWQTATYGHPSHHKATLLAMTALNAALAQPTLQTCNCRWDGEVQVQQCTLHEAHVDAIHEWAERAKTAEKKLAAITEPVQEPVASIYITPNGAREFDDWRHDLPVGSNLLYTSPPQRPAEPVQEPVQDDLIPPDLLFVCAQMGANVTRVRLAEPVQEPVAWRVMLPDGYQFVYDERMLRFIDEGIHATRQPLYTSPPQRPAEPVQEPYCHVYEYDDVFGLHREFYPREYNGRKPDRTVPLFTAPQRRAEPEGGGNLPPPLPAEPQHKPGCALLQIPARECDCGVEALTQGTAEESSGDQP